MDRFKISQLRSYYGNLLTEIQNEYLRYRFDEDLTYGEIAEIYNISRSAVLDAINKGVKLLEEYEEKLGLIKKDNEILSILNNIDTKDEKVLNGIEKIKNILED